MKYLHVEYFAEIISSTSNILQYLQNDTYVYDTYVSFIYCPARNF